MMTHRKLKKLLRSKPYLLNAAFSVGEDEAKALLKAHGCPTVSELSARGDWPPELKTLIGRLMNEPFPVRAKRRLKLVPAALGAFWNAHARQMIPAAAALLLFGFLALTPTGRGLVKNAYLAVAGSGEQVVKAPATEAPAIRPSAAPSAPASAPAVLPTDAPVSTRFLSLDAEHIPDAKLCAYLIDAVGAKKDDDGWYLTEEQVLSTEALDLPDGVHDLRGLESFPALSTLSWHADGSVSAVTLSTLPALRSLDLELPSVQEIDLSANAELVTVALLSGVQSLDVSANGKLDSLTVSGGSLASIELGTLPELRTLTLSNNALTALDVSGCPKLTELAVDGNELHALDLSANGELRLVALSGNHLKELSIAAAHATVNGDTQAVQASAPFAQDGRGYYYDMHLLVDDPSRVSFADEGMHYDPATGILRTDTPTDSFVYRYRTGNTSFNVTVMLPHGNALTIEFLTVYKNSDAFVRFSGSTAYMIYDGREKRPPIRVLDENGVILDPALYDVSYANNVNPGMAFVNVRMHDSDAFAFTTFWIVAPKVTGLSASVTSGGVRVSWSASAGADSYLVYRSEKPWNQGAWSSRVLLGRTSEPSWFDSDVTSFVNYRYTVQTCLSDNPDAGGESASSDAVLFIPAPALLSVYGEADEITATWSGVDGVDGYEIQVATDAGFSENVRSYEFFYRAVLEGTVDRLTPGVQYYIRVRVIGVDRFYSDYFGPWSNVKSCTIE